MASNLPKVKHISASQFAEVWKHYDSDGNGFIEGDELDEFLDEFISCMVSEGISPEDVISQSALEAIRSDFMDTMDENTDNKIDITELARILPTEENFLFLFRRDNPLDSSVEFIRVWNHFDVDHSGFIEADELKSFLKHLLRDQELRGKLGEEKLVEYTETIMNLFDRNNDSKLQLSEMARLLPVKENFLCRPIFKEASKITIADIDKVFSLYDRDGNQTIEEAELRGFLKDLMELVEEDYDQDDLEYFRKTILSQWDTNKDGKISKDELTLILMQQARLAAMSEDTSANGAATSPTIITPNAKSECSSDKTTKCGGKLKSILKRSSSPFR